MYQRPDPIIGSWFINNRNNYITFYEDGEFVQHSTINSPPYKHGRWTRQNKTDRNAYDLEGTSFGGIIAQLYDDIDGTIIYKRPELNYTQSYLIGRTGLTYRRHMSG